MNNFGKLINFIYILFLGPDPKWEISFISGSDGLICTFGFPSQREHDVRIHLLLVKSDEEVMILNASFLFEEGRANSTKIGLKKYWTNFLWCGQEFLCIARSEKNAILEFRLLEMSARYCGQYECLLKNDAGHLLHKIPVYLGDNGEFCKRKFLQFNFAFEI